MSGEEMVEREAFRRVVESLDHVTTSRNVVGAIIGDARDRITAVEARVRVLDARDGKGEGREYGGCGRGEWRWG